MYFPCALVRVMLSKKQIHTAGWDFLRVLTLRHKVEQPWVTDLPHLCESSKVLVDTDRGTAKKKINTQQQTKSNKKHLNQRFSFQICCDPEMTIFCYCSFIPIEGIRPTQNWLCLHKLDAVIDPPHSSFQKQQKSFCSSDRYVFLSFASRWESPTTHFSRNTRRHKPDCCSSWEMPIYWINA